MLLIDKSKFPRNKLCGGGLPLRVLNKYNYIKDKDLIESYTFGGIAYSSSLEYKVKFQKNNPVGAMILRKKFDYGLVKIAVNSGATLMDGKPVSDVKILKDKARILLQNGTNIDSKIVVGSDGVWSTIARKSGLAKRRKNVGMTLCGEYFVNTKTMDRYFGEKRICHIHMKPQGIAGYGWVFPKKKHVNIGIGEVNPVETQSKNLKKIFKDYISTLKESKIIPADLKICKIKGGVIPLFPLEKTYNDRLILCGDAAGFINPVSGEGIYYAMSSGEIAAKVITESLEADDTSERFLSRYQDIWKNDFGRDIKLLRGTNKQWIKGPKNFVKLASKDEKLAEMAFGILQGELSIYEYKWRLISRYLYVKFKDLFSRN